MARFRILGTLAVLCIVALVLGTLWRLVALFTGDAVSVTAAGATLAIVLVLVAGGVVAGRRSDRWTDNPYW